MTSLLKREPIIAAVIAAVVGELVIELSATNGLSWHALLNVALTALLGGLRQFVTPGVPSSRDAAASLGLVDQAVPVAQDDTSQDPPDPTS